MPESLDARTENLSIGDLSRRTGVNIETIRYYEKIGMLPKPPRTGGGRRVYGPDQTRLLAFTRRARELGFTLDEIRALLAIEQSAHVTCAEVRDIASRHLESVRIKLADLMRLEKILSKTIAQCTGASAPSCPVLDMLGTASGARVEISLDPGARSKG